MINTLIINHCSESWIVYAADDGDGATHGKKRLSNHLTLNRKICCLFWEIINISSSDTYIKASKTDGTG